MSEAGFADRMRAAYAADGSLLRLNFIASLDGAATLDGRSGGLGGAEDQRLMGVLRSLADVVLVGAGTVRAEGYGALRVGDEDAAWRESNGRSGHPRFAIVSGSLRLDPTSPLFVDAPTPPLVLTSEAAPRDVRAALEEVAEVVDCGRTAVEPARLLGALRERGLAHVLCEGGPHLAGSLVEAGLVDELCLTLGMTLVGGDAGRILRGAAEADRPMRLVHALPSADGALLFVRAAQGD
ncbi:pyrimidine reductase family protein [Agromyces seonyuensis]|uniref:Pyrimidine reductase family protein n=1 Tax=Agromyces seonyuensis TaxID=2662446 RepID=A0A6I4NTY3_9MICO|nr:pyrimidine reductase family protein [Agromyces seonyuensis]MWB97740.1 pyrimidine reductase family protein [Agromyces seonyuensis]